jgi:hypothetical protein
MLVSWTDCGRILAQHAGKTRVAVSLSSTIAQLIGSSSVALSSGMVKEVIIMISTSIPWFCQIITLNGEGCMNSQSSPPTNKSTNDDEDDEKPTEGGSGRGRRRGKENCGGVEGLVIFARREGEVIGRDEVISAFRARRLELANVQKE